MRAIHRRRISRLRRRLSRDAYASACRTASLAGLKSSFLESRNPFARSRIALWRLCAGTPRLTLAISCLDAQRPADGLAIRLRHRLLVLVVPLALLRLVLEQVALPRRGAHQLAGARHADALGESLPRLQLRHWSAAPFLHRRGLGPGS